jgi:tetratricopeptide (TPR) repeat protein
LRGDPNAALADWTAVIGLEPLNATALGRRASLYRQLGEIDKARADFATVLALDPDSMDARLGRGYIALQAGDWDQAVADLDQVILLQPGLALVHYGRSRALAGLGRYAEAMADVAEAVRRAPDQTEVCHFAAWLHVTCPDESLRDPVQAVRWATHACERTQWREAHCLDTLAAALAAQGNFTEAVRRQAEAVELVPSDQQEDLRSRLEHYKARQAA